MKCGLLLLTRAERADANFILNLGRETVRREILLKIIITESGNNTTLRVFFTLVRVSVKKGERSLLFKLQVKRNHIGNQVCRLRVVCIPDFQHIQTPEYTLWRCDPDACAEGLAGKRGKRIITGVILV